jgi:hypothetical protein
MPRKNPGGIRMQQLDDVIVGGLILIKCPSPIRWGPHGVVVDFFDD